MPAAGLHSEYLWTSRGWERDLAVGSTASGVVRARFALPGMPNLHSHAFQRAMAGLAERRGPGDDSFWTWRETMYAFASRIGPDELRAIAAQLYVEMVKAGYTHVCEFHYLHNAPDGRPYADPAAMSQAIIEAASEAGIGLTLLPVFYAHGDFGGAPATPLQRRFIHSTYTFERLFDALAHRSAAEGYVLGIAPHSLRAVTPEELAKVLRLAGADTPIHIHAAEQTREVDECYRWSGQRPVEWLIAHAGVDARWCLVHATHMLDREVAALAASGAVAGLAPSTEADLGDGTFAAEAYQRAGGRFGVGSDSNTTIDPFAELRQLEWSQRLRVRRRNVLVGDDSAPVGETLWRAALRGGAQALAQQTGRLAAGMWADFIVLDMDDPALAGQPVERVLDAAIFGPCRRAVRDLASRGRFVVRDGHHAREQDVLRRYRAALARIDLTSLA